MSAGRHLRLASDDEGMLDSPVDPGELYVLELGLRLRNLRERRGMTQSKLGRSAAVAADMISRLENGHYQSPGLRTLFRVAGGLSVGVAELLPDVIIDPETSLEGSLRSRLIMIAKKASLKDLELVLDLAETVLER